MTKELQGKVVQRGDIFYDARTQKYGIVESGRFQSLTPNIQNIPKSRDGWEAEHLWAKCREEQKLKTEEHRWVLCDTCHEKFRCWTASHPTNPFSEVVDAIKSSALTMNEIQKSMFEVAFKLGR